GGSPRIPPHDRAKRLSFLLPQDPTPTPGGQLAARPPRAAVQPAHDRALLRHSGRRIAQFLRAESRCVMRREFRVPAAPGSPDWGQPLVAEVERRAGGARQETAERRRDPDEIFESIAISEDNLPGEVEVAFNRFLDGLPGDRL